jgi:hypothetical protein
MPSFSAKIYKIGVNPYVLPPQEVLEKLFEQAGRHKSPLRVKGKLNDHPFKQTLVKYIGKWRLYLNTPMRKATGTDVGDRVEVTIEFDPAERTTAMPPKLLTALNGNKKALQVFESLPPSRRKEIMRYIGFLKSEKSIDKNVSRAIMFLLGKERFIGSDEP